jgi:lipopolysaccharide export system permease protein
LRRGRKTKDNSTRLRFSQGSLWVFVVKLIDRHVLFECLQTFIMALCAFVGLLLLQNVYDNLKDLVDYGASVGEIFYYYAVLMPSYLPTVLPLVFMIAILFSLGQLHRNSEIVAMRACGLSLWRITRSIWLMGVVLAVALFSLNAGIVPWSVEESRKIWDNYDYSRQLQTKSAEDVGLVHALAFNNFKDNRLWFINRYSQYSHKAYGVMVSELDARHGERIRTMANEAYYDDAAKDWVFIDGRIITFDSSTQDIIRSTPFARAEFSRFSESPLVMQLREKRAKDLSFNELRSVIASLPKTGDPDRAGYLVRYYSMAASPLICLIVVGISVPFAVSGVRVNPMVGISKSIGLFFGYYALSSVSTMLGTQGQIPPLIAALLPPAFAACLAVWLAFRARFA